MLPVQWSANAVAGLAAGGIRLMKLRPYDCRDDRCRDRQRRGIKCPWCWGGFPLAMPADTELRHAEDVLRRGFGDVEEVGE